MNLDSLTPAGSTAASADTLRQQVRERWAALGFETHLVSAGGSALHVAMGGAGQPLLLLHGYPQSGEIWRKIAPDLAREHRLIIPDLPGMGCSDPGARPHTLLAATQAIENLLESAGVSQAAVVGHDWGGAVGATLALAHPARVTRLVFIESAVAGAGFEALWRFDTPNSTLAFIPFLLLQGVAEALVAGREQVFLHHLWETFTADKTAAPFEDWTPYLASMRRPEIFTSSADYYRSAYQSAKDSQRLLAAGKLAIPVLPVGGERSFGAHVESMARNFASNVEPGMVCTGAGHFVPEERPDELRDAIRQFLK